MPKHTVHSVTYGFDTLDIEALAYEPHAVIAADVEIQSPGHGGAELLTVRVRNTTDVAVHLESVRIRIDLKTLGAKVTRILAGSGRMGAATERYDVSTTPFAVTSEAFVLMRGSDSSYVFAGFLTWKVFTGYFQFQDDRLVIHFHGDNKLIPAGRSIPLETILLARGGDWQAMLDRYADALRTTHEISLPDCRWKGWGSWDYYAHDIATRNIKANMQAIGSLGVPANLIQIDDGYQRMTGDWLTWDERKFPLGLPRLLHEIVEAGYTPGIWLAPFLAHQDSRLVAEHPDWLLKTDRGQFLDVALPNLILDYSRRDVCDWIAGVVSTMKQQWGVGYFKLDFLLHGLTPCRGGVDGVTPLERFHRCLRTIRDAVGNDIYLLGCSAIFGPCIGTVDGMRVGADIDPQFPSVRRSFNGGLSSYHLHRKVFHCDPDYLVLRAREDQDAECCAYTEKQGDLTFSQAEMWANFLSVFGNAVICGDKPAALREERRALLQRAFSFDACDQCVPLDLWAGGREDAPSFLLARKQETTYLALFNWRDVPQEMRISGWDSGDMLVRVPDDHVYPISSEVFATTLAGRSSLLVRYEGRRGFPHLRQTLVIHRLEEKGAFPDLVGEDFTPRGTPVRIDLGKSADCPLLWDRRGGRGMIRGLFAEAAKENTFLGIPFHFPSPDQDCVIACDDNDIPRKIEIGVHRKMHTLYFLHTCHIGVTGELNRYRIIHRDKTVEIPLVLGTHLGNSEAKYSLPWTSPLARIAWHDVRTDACLYLLEWHCPYPDEAIESIEVTFPVRKSRFFLVGITGFADESPPGHRLRG